MVQQEQMEITPEEFKAWTENKITKHTVNSLLEIKEYLKNYLAAGTTLGKDAEVSTDRIVGRIEGLTELFNLFNDTKEDTKEDTSYDH